ncbi:NAD-dependent epimerase/dehydratase family protein [Brevibacillus borstelensis]|uniref:NAD-dependent epimerase/dehydratase family protein n=1 Tax=Brevibacillus borstelensis TaxID=45462 RepID=UPI002E1DDA97|nr:NAD-dependent epimerase/dehydratase family protein [Brevibacillus borstelensis]MED2010498.1 NAD-dependent epimerase/dehydratase family protein [Brevibacillus borstelensis]
MKILVTGGAGFIGSHLVERLLREQHEVWALDDLSTGKRAFVTPLQAHPHMHFVQGSVLDRDLLQELMKKVDAVYHLAAVLGVKNTVENPLKVIEGNIDGTKLVLEAAFPDRKKVIFASTSEVYGKNAAVPFREDDDRILGSTATHRWCYSTAKALDEHLCLAYASLGLPVTILRYFNTYGPRATSSAYGGVIPRFVTAAIKGEPLYVYGTGEQTRCFTFIQDTVEGTFQALQPHANGRVINIGNDQPMTIMETAQLVVQLANSTSPIITLSYEEAYGPGYEDMQRRQPDLQRAKEVLNYSPKVSLTEGLKLTIDWYREHLQVTGSES